MATHIMVLTNFLLVCLIGIGLIAYKKKFPRKKLNLLSLLILLSLLPVWSIWRPGVYESGDFTLHIYRTMAFFDSLKSGIFFPTWAGSLNATYGYPLFIFIYPLPYYLLSIFHFLGFSFIYSMKVFLTLSFIASGIAMYYFAKENLREKAAVVASIFYLFAPYHLVDLHFRVDIGEVLAFVFLPLVFFCIHKYFKTKKMTWSFLAGIMFALLILSHQAVSLLTAPLVMLYVLFLFSLEKKKHVKSLVQIIIGFITGLLLSSFYWLPLFFAKQFTQSSNAKVGFSNFSEFFYSPWRYGLLFQGPNGELSFLIGYAQLFIFAIALYIIYRKKVKGGDKKYLQFFLILFFMCFFLMQSVSQPFWNLPLFQNIQFSYRLLSLVAFVTAMIAGYVAKNIKQTSFIIFICVFAIVSTILNWGNRRVIPTIDDALLTKYAPLSTYQAEGLGPAIPRWVNPKHPWMSTIPKQHLEIISGFGKVKEVSRTPNQHVYKITAETIMYAKENTLYFPGWTAKIDNKKVAIKLDNKYQGIILLNIPSGKHTVEINFQNYFFTFHN